MMAFGKTRLQFEYTVIQLNRLSWRKFLNAPNPAAAALMTKMKIAPKDRLKVTREIVRMIATLKLDPARTDLIGGFMDAYLKLSAAEMEQCKRRYESEITEEQETIMEWWSDIGKESFQKGKTTGKEELVIGQINRRFGSVPPQVTERLDALSADDLNELGLALLDFTSPADLETWLSQQEQH